MSWKPSTRARKVAERLGQQAAHCFRMGSIAKLAPDAWDAMAADAARGAWRTAIRYQDLIEHERAGGDVR